METEEGRIFSKPLTELHLRPSMIRPEADTFTHPDAKGKLIRTSIDTPANLLTYTSSTKYFLKQMETYGIQNSGYDAVVGPLNDGSEGEQAQAYVFTDFIYDAVSANNIVNGEVDDVDARRAMITTIQNILVYLNDLGIHGGMYSPELCWPEQYVYSSNYQEGGMVLVDVQPLYPHYISSLDSKPLLGDLFMYLETVTKVLIDAVRLRNKGSAISDIEIVASELIDRVPDLTETVMEVKMALRKMLADGDLEEIENMYDIDQDYYWEMTNCKKTDTIKLWSAQHDLQQSE